MSKKVIRDLLYGDIELDENALMIVDTPNFQRLKDISHLKADCLYPSATHTRFEHSLGAMHLSMKFFDSIQSDISSHLFRYMGYDRASEVENLINYYKTHLKYAALLHDVGHAPMSYLGEAFYDADEIHQKIGSVIAEKGIVLNDASFLYRSDASNHEKMSCYIILSKYYDTLCGVMSQANFDIEFLLRIVTGAKYNCGAKWVEDIIIGLLNSSAADADKIDNLIRDNFMTGNVASGIDINDFVSNLRLDTDSQQLVFNDAGRIADGILEMNNQLYFKVYNHHAVVYTEHITKSLLNNMFNAKNKKYDDRVQREDYFSCEAIADRLVSDSDIYALIKDKCGASARNTSPYGKLLFTQLFERKYLKPAWQTSSEFKASIESRIGDSNLMNEILHDLSSDAGDIYASRITDSVISKSKKLKQGDVFLVKRSNRFCPFGQNSVGMMFSGSSADWDAQALQDASAASYQDAAAYLFCKNEVRDIAENALWDVLTNREYK